MIRPRPGRLGLLALLTGLTAACATTRSTPARSTPSPRPSARATPRAQPASPSRRGGPAGEVTIGLASWYGREQQGHLTASGERFNMHELTAAHRRLPFGTRVRVTHLSNGKSVTVRINDRGPYGRGRIIDLSRAAAQAIDMIEAGVVRVRIEVLAEGSGSGS